MEPEAVTRARCNVCGVVIRSEHPWHHQSCACGRLSISGGQRHGAVSWAADPGSSWSDLTNEPEAEEDEEDAGANTLRPESETAEGPPADGAPENTAGGPSSG